MKNKINKNNKSESLAKNVETVKIGEIEFKLPFSGILPPLTDAETERLNESIAENGVQVPILVDEEYNVIDGEYRLKTAARNYAKSIPFEVRPNLTEQEKKQLMITIDLYRRHLTPKQVEKLIITFRSEGRSLRQIGEKLGISHSTVQRKLESSNVTGNTVELPKKIVGKDNKKRNAMGKPKRKPSINVNSLSELNTAVIACNTAGCSSMPNKNISLKRLERIARQEEKKRLRTKECSDFQLGKAELWFGDFRNKCEDIDDESVSVIFTDPPYAQKFLPLFNDVGKLAARVLKPSGLLLTYSGSMFLPQVHAMLSEHLDYFWTCAIRHNGSNTFVPNRNIHQGWKPILAYYKPPFNKYWRPFLDIVSGVESKEHHEWEQSVDEAVYYIKAVCPKNGILVDPMMGSGTTIIAGLKCGVKRCIGIDNDPVAFSIAQKRLNKFTGEMSNDAA